jgi:hypothetical protein
MRLITTLAVLAALSIAAPALADGYKLDAKGKCHDDHGKFAKTEMCHAHTYKPDSKGKCHDEAGKFAKADFCKH